MSLSISSAHGLETPLEIKKKKKSFLAAFNPQWTPAVCGGCARGAGAPTEITGRLCCSSRPHGQEVSPEFTDGASA